MNQKDNVYQIQGNQGCITHEKKKGEFKLKTGTCSRSPSQQFNLHNITDHEEYNKYLVKPVDEFGEISYPFNIITPKGAKQKCVSMRGNKMAVENCIDSKYHRFEPLFSYKNCDSKYSN